MIPILPENIIRHLINYFSGQLTIINCFPIGGGCISHACKLETNKGIFFLKWKDTGPADLFLREAESLNEMGKSDSKYLILPKPIFAKEIDETPGYLLTDFLEGGKAGNDEERLGYGLASLHRVKADKFGFYKNNYCGSTLQHNSYQLNWFTFYSINRIGHLVNMISENGNWSSADSQLMEKFMYKVEPLLSHDPVPSLIHGDLWSGNCMSTKLGPAIIDPSSSYCDREFEMGIMTMFGGFSQRVYEAYNEAFPLLQGWKERNLIYQLYHVLNHYYLFGGYYKIKALEIMKHYL